MATTKEREEVIAGLARLGILTNDAQVIRRNAVVLRRWFEMECGTEINGRSVCIERDENDRPFQRTQYRLGREWIDNCRPVNDLEARARKKLASIMERYHGLKLYIQGDCRGPSVYILRAQDIRPGENIDSVYNRGVAVY